jgi:hypothetical protein
VQEGQKDICMGYAMAQNGCTRMEERKRNRQPYRERKGQINKERKEK